MKAYRNGGVINKVSQIISYLLIVMLILGIVGVCAYFLVRPQGVSVGTSAARGRAGKHRRGCALQASRLHAARGCELRRRAGRRRGMSSAVLLRSYAGEADAAAERIAAFWLAHSDYVQTREESLDDLRAPSSDTESTGGEGNHVVS